jgi:predicted DNA-binding transcriptional regulator AlpA
MTVKISNEVRSPRLDDIMDRQALAAFLGVSDRTVDRWHLLRTGPPRIKVGNKVLYRASAVLDWLRRNETGDLVSK